MEKIMAYKEKPTEKDAILNEIFKRPTAEIVHGINEIRKYSDEDADNMIAQIVVGILALTTKDVDQAFNKFDKLKQTAYQLLCEVDKIVVGVK